MTIRADCRACGGPDLVQFLDLGSQPLANAFLPALDDARAEARFPLEVFVCANCGLVQLRHVIDPEVLFRNYVYVTGTSTTIARHNAAYAATVVELLGLGPQDLVVETASNDGSLLSCFASHGVRTLGVEPARNIADAARARGIDTVAEFFTEEAAAQLRAHHGGARAVIGNNVLAHVDDPSGFLRGMGALLEPGGLAIVEVPWLGEMIERREYDTIYHEHLSYFSVTALLRLCENAGLAARRVDRVPVHGGSIRLYAERATGTITHAGEVLAIAAEEERAGLTSPRRLAAFGAGVAANRAILLALLAELRARGKRLAAYGAPAKGNTLLNYCGIGAESLICTFDRSPHKIGLYTPGSHLPVLSADRIREIAPDYLLLLAWNFAEEIMSQQAAFRAAGGRFIVPIPDPVVV
jgi:hypothetical protein